MPGVKTLEWDKRSKIMINMGFGKVFPTQVGLVLNMMNGSISLQFHIILMLYCTLF